MINIRKAVFPGLCHRSLALGFLGSVYPRVYKHDREKAHSLAHVFNVGKNITKQVFKKVREQTLAV